MKNLNFLFSSTASLCLHALLAIIVFWQFYEFTKLSSENSQKIISAYIYKNNETSLAKIVLKKDANPTLKNTLSSSKMQSSKPVAITSSGNSHFELLQLLHSAIARNQQFPESAAALNQTGEVRLAFRLFPDGHIEELKIVKSSGIQSLDNAALEAVTATFPYKRSTMYLKEPKEFNIDIEFQ